jgi:hypothetical protein
MKEEIKTELLNDVQLINTAEPKSFRISASDYEQFKSVEFNLPDGSVLAINKSKYSYPETSATSVPL